MDKYLEIKKLRELVELYQDYVEKLHNIILEQRKTIMRHRMDEIKHKIMGGKE